MIYEKNKIIFLFIICFIINISFAKAEEIKLVKCVDGDTATFLIDQKETKVRFLAVDTPETKHPTKGEEPFGKEASNFTCNSLKKANKIEIEYDQNSEKKDKYDRALGWIFIDDNLLQSKLVENGLAKVAYLYDDYKYTSELQKLEKQAKKDKVGIWGDYKEDYTKIYITIGIILIVIIYCIIDKKYHKKTLYKMKRKTKKQLNKEIEKMIEKKSKY